MDEKWKGGEKEWMKINGWKMSRRRMNEEEKMDEKLKGGKEWMKRKNNGWKIKRKRKRMDKEKKWMKHCQTRDE